MFEIYARKKPWYFLKNQLDLLYMHGDEKDMLDSIPNTDSAMILGRIPQVK